MKTSGILFYFIWLSFNQKSKNMNHGSPLFPTLYTIIRILIKIPVASEEHQAIYSYHINYLLWQEISYIFRISLQAISLERPS